MSSSLAVRDELRHAVSSHREYVDDTGTVGHPLAVREQNQRLFALADRRLGRWTIEPGLGVGLAHASDRLTVKLLLSRDLP